MKTTKIKTILKNIASDSDVLKELIETIIPKLDLPPYMLGFRFTKKRKTKGDKKHGPKRCNQSKN